MGRLFWKFFLSILLAQLAATIGVGTMFWLRDQARAQAPAIDTGPSAEFLIDSAAATLAHGGSTALRQLVGEASRYSVFVIDDQGNDMLAPPEPRLGVCLQHRRHSAGRVRDAQSGDRRRGDGVQFRQRRQQRFAAAPLAAGANGA